MKKLILIAALVLSSSAFADDEKPAGKPAAEKPAAKADGPALDIHGGLHLRTDVGVHPIRLTAGVGYGKLDVNLVLDPMFWTDGQTHTDLTANWRFGGGVGPMLGWRFNNVALGDAGLQFQHNLLVGLGADLPSFWDDRIRATFGFELAAMVVKHGGGAAAETISFKEGSRYIDFLAFAFFVRVEYGQGL
jgi:hypothetical protein